MDTALWLGAYLTAGTTWSVFYDVRCQLYENATFLSVLCAPLDGKTVCSKDRSMLVWRHPCWGGHRISVSNVFILSHLWKGVAEYASPVLGVRCHVGPKSNLACFIEVTVPCNSSYNSILQFILRQTFEPTPREEGESFFLVRSTFQACFWRCQERENGDMESLADVQN